MRWRQGGVAAAGRWRSGGGFKVLNRGLWSGGIGARHSGRKSSLTSSGPATTAPSGIVFLHGGVVEESGISLTLGVLSPGENQDPASWIGDGGVLDVASLFKASLRETQLGGALWLLWCVALVFVAAQHMSLWGAMHAFAGAFKVEDLTGPARSCRSLADSFRHKGRKVRWLGQSRRSAPSTGDRHWLRRGSKALAGPSESFFRGCI